MLLTSVVSAYRSLYKPNAALTGPSQQACALHRLAGDSIADGKPAAHMLVSIMCVPVVCASYLACPLGLEKQCACHTCTASLTVRARLICLHSRPEGWTHPWY